MIAGTDVAVVGAGIVGLATAYALVERGAAVTVYERGLPGNGQSGGDSRIFRHSHRDRRLVSLACEARTAWRDWEEQFGEELLSRDGVVGLGAAHVERLQLLRDAGVRAREIGAGEVRERLPLLAHREGPAMLDEDGGVIRTRPAIEALVGALGDALVQDEVIALRATASGTVEVRAGGVAAEHGRVVVCAGRGTAALARGVGLPLPMRHSAHARLSHRLRGEPPELLPCLLDAEAGAYGDPLPGNAGYAVGLGDTPVHEDGSPIEVGGLAATAEGVAAYVAHVLPGLDPEPFDVRHCWVTELPWSSDGIAVWETGGLLFVAGNNMFKHAPALGRALARAALGEGVEPHLLPEAKLGAGQLLPRW